MKHTKKARKGCKIKTIENNSNISNFCFFFNRDFDFDFDCRKQEKRGKKVSEILKNETIFSNLRSMIHKARFSGTFLRFESLKMGLFSMGKERERGRGKGKQKVISSIRCSFETDAELRCFVTQK